MELKQKQMFGVDSEGNLNTLTADCWEKMYRKSILKDKTMIRFYLKNTERVELKESGAIFDSSFYDHLTEQIVNEVEIDELEWRNNRGEGKKCFEATLEGSDFTVVVCGCLTEHGHWSGDDWVVPKEWYTDSRFIELTDVSITDEWGDDLDSNFDIDRYNELNS